MIVKAGPLFLKLDKENISRKKMRPLKKTFATSLSRYYIIYEAFIKEIVKINLIFKSATFSTSETKLK